METKQEPASTVGLRQMLSTNEVARALGVNPSTVCRWRAQGVGPRVYWLGKSCPRYREQERAGVARRNAA